MSKLCRALSEASSSAFRRAWSSSWSSSGWEGTEGEEGEEGLLTVLSDNGEALVRAATGEAAVSAL